MTRASAVLVCVLVAAPASAAPRDALARRIGINVRDADVAAAAAQIAAASQVSVAVGKGVPPARHSLAVKDAPLRDVLDAIGSLYGVQWLLKDGKILLRPDPLCRLISLELTDASQSVAVARFMEAVRAKAPFENMSSSRRVTIKVKDVPARDVANALMALYGMRRPSTGSGPAPSPVPPVAPEGPAGVSTALAALLQAPSLEEPGSVARQAANACMSSFTHREFDAMVPGQRMSLDALAPQVRVLALQTAQITALGSIACVLKQHPNHLDPQAAATGQGVVFGRTKDGNWLGLWMPSAGGTMTSITARQMVPGTPPPSD